MSVYKRGDTWWYKFRFNGQVIRDSAKTKSKSVARDAERARRRELELAVNRIRKRERMPMFEAGAEEWLDTKTGLAPNSLAAYRVYADSLCREFGKRLVCDIDLDDIFELQRKRQREGKSARTVNYEVHSLRCILKHFNLWWPLADKVKMLHERHGTGKALSREEEFRLLDAVARSSSCALLPLFAVSLDTGLRASEIRAIRRRDLATIVCDGQIIEGELHVPKSKTEAGTGRTIPLTERACAALTLWLARLPEVGPEAYVFPRHLVGFDGNSRRLTICRVEFDKPIGQWKTAWRRALDKAKVKARWHDLRHTLISRLAENPNVSEETIRSLAGHVSRQMLARYSHIRTEAKRAAIRSLEHANLGRGGAQNEAQSQKDKNDPQLAVTVKYLN